MVSTMWNKFGLRHYLPSENIVRCAIGQLFNNAKSLEAPGYNGSGMYGRYCMLNHCCVSNAKCILNEAGTFPLYVRAQTKILQGQEITTRYVKNFWLRALAASPRNDFRVCLFVCLSVCPELF